VTKLAYQSLVDAVLSTQKPKYKMKFVHGKYSIYRSEYHIEWGGRRSTTLAKGLDKTTATGMMKLLEDKND
jgi:hypothetical protein